MTDDIEISVGDRYRSTIIEVEHQIVEIDRSEGVLLTDGISEPVPVEEVKSDIEAGRLTEISE